MIKNQSIQTEEMTIGEQFGSGMEEMISKKIEELKNEIIPCLDDDSCKNDIDILSNVLDIIYKKMKVIQDDIISFCPDNKRLINALKEVEIGLYDRGVCFLLSM